MKTIRFTAKASGLMDARVPDVGLHFNRGEEKKVTDEQAALLLTNADFEEVNPVMGTESTSFTTVSATNVSGATLSQKTS